MKGNKAFVVFGLVFCFIGCREINKEASLNLPTEQTAIDFVFDSLYLSDPFESHEVILPPFAYDSVWLSAGFLARYTLYSDSVAFGPTSPYYDEWNLRDFKDELPDSLLTEAIEFINDHKQFNRNKRVPIRLPKMVLITTRNVFEKTFLKTRFLSNASNSLNQIWEDSLRLN